MSGMLRTGSDHHHNGGRIVAARARSENLYEDALGAPTVGPSNCNGP